MNEHKIHYQLKTERHVLITAVFTAVLAAGLLLTMTQVGKVQTTRNLAAAPQDNACASANKDDVIKCCPAGPVELNQSNPLNPVWECKTPAAPAAAAPAAPAGLSQGDHPELNNNCPIGGGLTSVCKDGAVCRIGANSNGGCFTAPKGDPGPANNSNCAPAKSATIPNPPPGIACGEGYTCKEGFCMKTPTAPGGGGNTGGGQAGGSPGGTGPAPGPVCSGTTKLSIEEARKLNGICPEVDPGNPGKNICKDFCTANPDSDKCKKNGIYACENDDPNKAQGKCQATCNNGESQAICGTDTGANMKCCKPAPPPPPPPPPAQANNPATPRTQPVAVRSRTVPREGTAAAVANCKRTCKAPLTCDARGRCNGPGAARKGDPACDGKPAGSSCGAGKTCRSFGSGGINSPGLYCQVGADILPPNTDPLNTRRIIVGALANGAACKNGTECASKNCAPNGSGGWACK